MKNPEILARCFLICYIVSMQSTHAMLSTTGLNMKYTVNNTAVEHFTITDSERIKKLLFGVNKFQGFEESHETFESFKNFIADELILMNCDEYPMQFIPSDDLHFFLNRYSDDHEVIYVAEIDTSKINESDFNEAYNK